MSACLSGYVCMCICMYDTETCVNVSVFFRVCLYAGGGLHRGGRGGGRPPNLSIGGASPPNFRLQYKEVPKSPLLSIFCNSVYWLKPHNNVNSRPPNLEVLPPPLVCMYDTDTCVNVSMFVRVCLYVCMH